MLGKNKILILEDSPPFLHILTRLLQTDYDVRAISDAVEGIELCKTFEPDLILLDVMLPGDMDGFTFMKHIRNSENLNHVPIYLMSALTSEDMILEGLKLGANDYFVKPFNINHLLLRINNILNLIAYNRIHAHIFQHIGFDAKKSSDNLALVRFENLMEEIIFSDYSLAEIADKMDSDEKALLRVIKDKYGIRPRDYIIKKKLEKSHILLQSIENYTVADIASMLKFASTSYYSKCFKDYFGLYPSELKRSYDN